MVKSVNNWIDGHYVTSKTMDYLKKFNPHNGKVITKLPNSTNEDVKLAIDAASKAFLSWSQLTSIERSKYLFKFVSVLKAKESMLAKCVAEECGKPIKDALGEVSAAILQGEYFASEGMRMYGKTLSSSMRGKVVQSIRAPLGVAALIVPANTPIANIAWKVFPALICGNTVVLKASEDAPVIANIFAELSKKSLLPDGVLNVVHGSGEITGEALTNDKRIKVISFTGSTAVGKVIAMKASKNLKRVSLELGGKNPIVICDDADLDNAIKWSLLSAFSNAGQRCASASRILVSKNIYDKFKKRIVLKAKKLRLGINDTSDLGPVINSKQYKNIMMSIKRLVSEGGNVICGENPLLKKTKNKGYYIKPTIVENLPKSSFFLNTELFGPVCSIEPFSNLNDAIKTSNSSVYGLTAAIHTKNIDNALNYSYRVNFGTVNVNIGTFGSEPHMPFGGFGESGNGTREPGIEALDVYSELKNISIVYDINKK